MGTSELGRQAEQCGGMREEDVETLWHMTGVLSFLTTSFHPFLRPVSFTLLTSKGHLLLSGPS